jgi:molecular chaperone DnaK (HSP70)
MVSNIGIKIANGEFYPLIEENAQIKKRMILTTAYDNQSSVQVDLFRSSRNDMVDAQYIGSIVVENIQPKPKGEPSIEMVISSNSNGDIIADAIDLDTEPNGEHHVLTVSLKSLDETASDIEILDFDIESHEELSSGLYSRANKVRNKKKRSIAWLFILLVIIIILGLLAGWLFFMGGMDVVNSKVDLQNAKQVIEQYTPKFLKKNEPAKQSKAAETVKQSEPEPVKVSEPVKSIEPVPIIETPAQPSAPKLQTASNRSPPPVASFNVPATIPREGVDYRIRWGDTLWDISNAFYRDPWQYRRIARYNNIGNPNYIISGRIIKVPPKN